MRFFSSALVFGMTSLFSLQAFAAPDGATIIPPATTSATTTTGTVASSRHQEQLNLDSVTPIDTNTLKLVFNLPVATETLKLKIDRQIDNSSLRVASKGFDSKDDLAVIIKLTDPLVASTTYTLTIVSAETDLGVNIKEGASAIKEFKTPATLKKPDPETLSAPTNTDAVITPSPTKTVSNPSNSDVVVKETVTPSKTGKDAMQDYPEAGMNPLFLLFLILPVTFFFLTRKKNA